MARKRQRETATEITYERPALYPKQKSAMFTKKRISVIEASTKSGKTVSAMAWIFERAMEGQDGWSYWWIAPVYKQSRIAYRRFKRFAEPRNAFKFNDSDGVITLPNGTQIWFMSATNPDDLYGEDVYAAVIDEGTRCKQEAWHAVRSTLTATQGPIRIIGNVKGRKNWMFKLAKRAKSGAKNMHYAKITAYDAAEAGVIPFEEIEEAKDVLPEAVFNELYLAEPSDDEGNPFGYDAIERCASDTTYLTEPVAWGWDLAKASTWTVGIGIDEMGHVCRLHRFQLPWGETEAKIKHLTGDTFSLIDSTGVGDPVVERLQIEGLNVQGLKFSQQSKQQLIEGLVVAIQNVDTKFPRGSIIHNELESFEYQVTVHDGHVTGVKYTASEGMTDDAVMAYALAVKAWRQQRNLGEWWCGNVDVSDQMEVGWVPPDYIGG